MKRGIWIYILVMLLLALPMILAQNYKLEVSTTQESYKSGENITLRISLLDSNNNPINTQVQIIIEDSEKMKRIEKTISSNELVNINLGEGVTYGYWTITAEYQGTEAKGLFLVEMNELAKFEINNDILTVTNIGNSIYSKTIQIIIGDTVGARTPRLDIGEKVQYRLIAPEGDYEVKVTDGITTLTKSQVQLTGTGQIIGTLDEASKSRNPITGGISPDEENDIGLLSYIKNSSLVYIFILVVFGVAILLAIQRKLIKK